MPIERTFIAVKPDGVRRRLVADIISRFEKRGYTMIAAKLMMPSEELVKEHYAEHAGKPFMASLIKYIRQGPVFAMVWEGEDVIAQARRMMGATRPTEAAPGTIRFEYCQCPERNVIHGSDSPDSAEREINLWFTKSELCERDSIDSDQLLPSSE